MRSAPRYPWAGISGAFPMRPPFDILPAGAARRSLLKRLGASAPGIWILIFSY